LPLLIGVAAAIGLVLAIFDLREAAGGDVRVGRLLVAALGTLLVLGLLGRIAALQYGWLAVIRVQAAGSGVLAALRKPVIGWESLSLPAGDPLHIEVAPAPDWAPWLTTVAGREFHHCRITLSTASASVFVDVPFPIHGRAVHKLERALADAGIDLPVTFAERIHSRRTWWRQVNSEPEPLGSPDA
jgi:hypothetical protein